MKRFQPKRTGSLRKATAILLAFSLLTLLLTACGGKSEPKVPVTVDTYISTVEGLGYAAADTASNYADFEHIEQCIGFIEGFLDVEFFKFDTSDSALSFFENMQETINAKATGTRSWRVSPRNGKSQTFTENATDHYYLLSWVEDTLVYAYCGKTTDKEALEAAKEEIKKIIEAIGY